MGIGVGAHTDKVERAERTNGDRLDPWCLTVFAAAAALTHGLVGPGRHFVRSAKAGALAPAALRAERLSV